MQRVPIQKLAKYLVLSLLSPDSVVEVGLQPPDYALPVSPAMALHLGTSATTSARTGTTKAVDGLEEGLTTAEVREFFLRPGAIPELSGILLLKRKGDGGWSASVAKTTLPLVLTKAAVDAGWMPPPGKSGLPSSLAELVPEGLRYWEATDDAARASQRAALVEAGLFTDDVVKVVDGELRLVRPAFFLYDPAEHGPLVAPPRPPPEPTDPPAGAAPPPPVTKSLSPLARVLGARAAAPLHQPMLDGATWPATLRAVAEKGEGTLFVSAPEPELLGEVVTALGATPPRGDWMVETAAGPGAVAALAKLGRPFAVPRLDGHLFVSSFLPADPSVVRWESVAKEEAQKVVKVAGLDVHIDRPAGYVQTGTAPDGTAWSRTYKVDYGFLPGTTGGDAEELDVFVGPDPASERAWFVDQHKADGTFDEFKLFLGFDSPEAVEKTYTDHIPREFMGKVHEVTAAQLRACLGVEPVVAMMKALSAPQPAAAALRSVALRLFKADSPAAEEERFVLGIVLEPDSVDKQQDTYSADDVRKTAHRYMQDFRNLGLMHKSILPDDRVKILESYLAPVDFTIGDQAVKKGTWLLGVRVMDDALWEQVKAGGLTGFSIGGSAVRTPVEGESSPAAS